MRLIRMAALFAAATTISIGAPMKPLPGYIAEAVADPGRPETDRFVLEFRRP